MSVENPLVLVVATGVDALHVTEIFVHTLEAVFVAVNDEYHLGRLVLLG